LVLAVEDESNERVKQQSSRVACHRYLPSTSLPTNFHNVHSVENDDSSSSEEEVSHENQERQTRKDLHTLYSPNNIEYVQDDPQMNTDSDLENEEDEDDVFNPYLFIASLPKNKHNLIKPHSDKLLPDKLLNSSPVTLVLDLDETLVHCSVEPFANPDYTFPVIFNENCYTVYVRCRPGYKEFLETVSRQFEVVVFTASQEIYAKTLLDKLDPKKEWIKYRLYRESCVSVDGNFLKDLDFLNRDLSKTVIVDNSPQAFAYQLDNGIPIKSFFEDENDRELLNLLPFLQALRQCEDVRPLIRDRFKLAAKVAKFATNISFE